MKEYLFFETKLFMNNKRNQFLFLGILIFLLGLLFYIPLQKVNDIETKTKMEASMIKNAISYVPTHEIEENPDSKEYSYYSNLLKDSRAVALQEVALTMHQDLPMYVKAGVEATSVRIQAHEEGYGDLPKEFIIPLSQSLSERAIYTYLQNKGIPIEENAQNGVSFLALALTWFSGISYFFLLILSSDVLLQDEDHKTIIDSYPLHASQKTRGKIAIQTLSTSIFLSVLFFIGYLISTIVFKAGNWNSPLTIYWRETYYAVPTYLYVCILILFYFLFNVHMILFSSILNIMFKNQYLNIFVGGSLYVIGFLFSPKATLLRFTPINYLNPAGVLNGRLAEQLNQPSNDAFTASIVFLIWSILYALVLSFVFARKYRMKKVPSPKGVDAS